MYKTIDLHGFTTLEAKRYLDQVLKDLPQSIREVTILHGYISGQALANMVRGYKHPRIERKMRSLNQGETIFLLYTKQMKRG